MILKQRRVYFTPKYIIYVLRVNKAQAFIQVMNDDTVTEPFYITKSLGPAIRECKQIRL